MYDPQEVHLHESQYIKKVTNYLLTHYGKKLDDLAISLHEVAQGLHDHLLPHEFVDKNAKGWGIKILGGASSGTPRRILSFFQR